MSQSTEIKMTVGLTKIEHVYGSRVMAQYFDLNLIEGEDVRELNFTGMHFAHINMRLQEYLKEFPNDVVTKVIRQLLSAAFIEYNELHADSEEDVPEMELQFQVRLTN